MSYFSSLRAPDDIVPRSASVPRRPFTSETCPLATDSQRNSIGDVMQKNSPDVKFQ